MIRPIALIYGIGHRYGVHESGGAPLLQMQIGHDMGYRRFRSHAVRLKPDLRDVLKPLRDRMKALRVRVAAKELSCADSSSVSSD